MRIAVTGGIGVGKSEVMKIISSLGYKVASADEINARLLLRADYIEKIQTAFPSAVVDGKINKDILRKIIFNDYDKRQLLNSIAHPIIFSEIKRAGLDLFVEVPLLFESGMQTMFDKIIVITAPYDIRVSRLFDRSGIDKILAHKMIMSQLSDGEREKYADYIIENKASYDELYRRVREMLIKIEADTGITPIHIEN
ncbi:MAG: dephospho-CoA kinase [Clostridia bacterium]